MRELDQTLGLSELSMAALQDSRKRANKTRRPDGLFRKSFYGRLAGCVDVDAADHLALDPVMRQIIGGRAVDGQAASVSQMGGFETKTLALPENWAVSADLSGQWIDRMHRRIGLQHIVLDMGRSVSSALTPMTGMKSLS